MPDFDTQKDSEIFLGVNDKTSDMVKHPSFWGSPEINPDFEKMIEHEAVKRENSQVVISRQQVRFLAPGLLSSQPYALTTNRVILNQVKSANLSSGAFTVLTDRAHNVVAFGQSADYLNDLDIECDGLNAYAVVSADLGGFALTPYFVPSTVIVPGDTNSNTTAAIVYFRELI